MSVWPPVPLISENGDVVAGTLNEIVAALTARTNDLRATLEAAATGGALLRTVSCDPAAVVGDVVYYDVLTNRVARAEAKIGYSVDGVYGDLADTARVFGVITEKLANDTAVVGVAGVLDNGAGKFVPTAEASGVRYLSTTPGQLTTVRPSVGSPVGFWMQSDNVFLVYAQSSNFGAEHEHKTIELAAEPSGAPNNPDAGENHHIVTVNTAIRGWLPADNAVFGGAAPAGALFGYNLAAHPALSAVFPPAPIDACSVEVLHNGFVAGRSDEVVKVTATGIWWMRRDYGWAPWSPDWWTINGGTPLEYDAGTSTVEPPVDMQAGHTVAARVVRIRLHMHSRPAQALSGYVSSLRVTPGSILRLKSCDTGDDAATTGNLCLSADLSLTDGVTTNVSPLAIKSISDAGVVEKGPVLVSAQSLSPQIVATVTNGNLVLQWSDASSAGVSTMVALTKLDGVREDSVSGLLCLTFPSGRATSMTSRIELPAGVGNLQVRMRLALFGKTAGTLPALAVSAQVVAPASATPAALPTSQTSLGSTATAAVGAMEQVMVQTPAVTVGSGSTIFLTVARAASDGYANDVRVLRQTVYFERAL